MPKINDLPVDDNGNSIMADCEYWLELTPGFYSWLESLANERAIGISPAVDLTDSSDSPLASVELVPEVYRFIINNHRLRVAINGHLRTGKNTGRKLFFGLTVYLFAGNATDDARIILSHNRIRTRQ